MLYHYQIVNVFTRSGGRFTGNPLCVFENAEGLDAETMQALALQFNLSETTFITASDKADARVRIFAPSYEMPFAGHPTLGTAYVVRMLQGSGDLVRLELNVGVIPVTADGVRFELRSNPPVTRPAASAGKTAEALGLSESELAGDPLWVNTGSEQLIVPLKTESAVRRVEIGIDSLEEITKDGPRPQAYFFAPTGPDTLYSRFFFTKGKAVLEDPATGSATANLGGWFLARNPVLPLQITISQGELVGRPSTLFLRIDRDRQIFVAGEVLSLGRGSVEL